MRKWKASWPGKEEVNVCFNKVLVIDLYFLCFSGCNNQTGSLDHFNNIVGIF